MGKKTGAEKPRVVRVPRKAISGIDVGGTGEPMLFRQFLGRKPGPAKVSLRTAALRKLPAAAAEEGVAGGVVPGELVKVTRREVEERALVVREAPVPVAVSYAERTAAANRGFVAKVYADFFPGGRLLGAEERERAFAAMYEGAGSARSGYLKEALTPGGWWAFTHAPWSYIDGQALNAVRGRVFPSDADVFAAELANFFQNPYEQRYVDPATGLPDPLGRYPSLTTARPRTMEGEARKGDYFFLRNGSPKFDTVTSTAGRTRRIVLDVRNQGAAVSAALAVARLFDDDAVSPHLSELKVFLKTTPVPAEPVLIKRDKLIVYYNKRPGEAPDTDAVGAALDAAIKSSFPPGDAVDEAGPFYALLGGGTAWAEDPSGFTGDGSQSFTQTRLSAVRAAIEAPGADAIDSPDALGARIRTAFAAAGIDPDRPHLQLRDRPFRAVQENRVPLRDANPRFLS
ncbi:T3SS effector HopA1 family protein [Actinocorallia longicatena]|uniref:Uncharacterized protein n=1 Tax=Actinocorallia longicatena TaxID=111803 RepID=A0ABP6Q812_9ACTN